MREPELVQRLRRADPEHVRAIANRLIATMQGAIANCGDSNGEGGFVMAVAYTLDTNPARVMDLLSVYRDLIAEALDELEGVAT